MFEVVLCQENLPIPYHHFTLKEDGELTIDPVVLGNIIAQRFNDKIQPDVGLMIDLYDIVHVYECRSVPDTPMAYARTVFRMVVFNPPIGSVWVGDISSCNEDGIQITLSFFGDIWIPYLNLPLGSEYSDELSLWIWKSPDDDDESEQLYFDHGDSVRFRVCEVKYNKKKEDGPLMMIVGSMNSAGLGPIRWWVNPEENEDE